MSEGIDWKFVPPPKSRPLSSILAKSALEQARADHYQRQAVEVEATRSGSGGSSNGRPSTTYKGVHQGRRKVKQGGQIRSARSLSTGTMVENEQILGVEADNQVFITTTPRPREGGSSATTTTVKAAVLVERRLYDHSEYFTIPPRPPEYSNPIPERFVVVYGWWAQSLANGGGFVNNQLPSLIDPPIEFFGEYEYLNSDRLALEYPAPSDQYYDALGRPLYFEACPLVPASWRQGGIIQGARTLALGGNNSPGLVQLNPFRYQVSPRSSQVAFALVEDIMEPLAPPTFGFYAPLNILDSEGRQQLTHYGDFGASCSPDFRPPGVSLPEFGLLDFWQNNPYIPPQLIDPGDPGGIREEQYFRQEFWIGGAFEEPIKLFEYVYGLAPRNIKRSIAATSKGFLVSFRWNGIIEGYSGNSKHFFISHDGRRVEELEEDLSWRASASADLPCLELHKNNFLANIERNYLYLPDNLSEIYTLLATRDVRVKIKQSRLSTIRDGDFPQCRESGILQQKYKNLRKIEGSMVGFAATMITRRSEEATI